MFGSVFILQPFFHSTVLFLYFTSICLFFVFVFQNKFRSFFRNNDREASLYSTVAKQAFFKKILLNFCNNSQGFFIQSSQSLPCYAMQETFLKKYQTNLQ
jgi:hypothetical protein